MTRTRITAVALAAALALSGIQVAEAPSGIAQPAQPAANQASEKNARLAAQAIEELINEYREANGLNRLVTHEVYDAKALGWSQQMVKDLRNPQFGEPVFKNGVRVNDGAFRHSNREDWGYSGENIVFSGPYADSEEAWRRAASELFEDWRNSPDHNANMLSPVYQGVGLGLVRTARGEIWATTMFFIDDTPVVTDDGQSGQAERDDATEAAIASGAPFYVPAGARARLGVPGVPNPTDTRNHTVSLAVSFEGGETGTVVPQAKGEGQVTHTWDKTKGAPAGLDPLVTGQKIGAAPPATTTTQKVPPSAKPSTTTSTSPTQSKPATPPSSAPTVPSKPTSPTPTTSTNASTTTPPTQNPSPANPPAGNGGGGSSSVGIVIGVVLALLAVVGAAAVAMPMVMPGGGR
ncbi:CAP domain-containing protein [Corynebacterium bouchesdurhonense]|uniref:CAP domain-containing protein n=1 Tax=Corynebacterium bouchesdurhonense TaxID=1720192 RepID=UPI0008366005|nr:CAP domain-containing protein [Corynebacterium bouchesdurhonense]